MEAPPRLKPSVGWRRWRMRPVLSLPDVDGWDEGGDGPPLSVAMNANINTWAIFAACRASKKKEQRRRPRQR